MLCDIVALKKDGRDLPGTVLIPESLCSETFKSEGMETSPKSEGELWNVLSFPHRYLSYYCTKQVISQEKISTEPVAVLLQLEVWRSRIELQQLPLPQAQPEGGIGASCC